MSEYLGFFSHSRGSKGGLGNQLYCYAAAKRLAIKNNTELIVDDVSGFKRDYEGQMPNSWHSIIL